MNCCYSCSSLSTIEDRWLNSELWAQTDFSVGPGLRSSLAAFPGETVKLRRNRRMRRVIEHILLTQRCGTQHTTRPEESSGILAMVVNTEHGGHGTNLTARQQFLLLAFAPMSAPYSTRSLALQKHRLRCMKTIMRR